MNDNVPERPSQQDRPGSKYQLRLNIPAQKRPKYESRVECMLKKCLENQVLLQKKSFMIERKGKVKGFEF